MAFDGLFLAAMVRELNGSVAGSRVNRIYQPSVYEIVIHLYGPRGNARLLLSAHPKNSRVQLTDAERPNPHAPPMFCMILRKHLEGGRLISAEQPGLERVCQLKFAATDELGELSEKVLVAEIMGKHSNITLLDRAGRILDACKRVPHTLNRYREVLPGRMYMDPPAQDKVEAASDQGELARRLAEADPTRPIWEAVLKNTAGFGPLSSREAVARASLNPETRGELLREEQISGERVAGAAAELEGTVREGVVEPSLYWSKNGRAAGFSPFPLSLFGDLQRQTFDTLSELLDRVYEAAEREERLDSVRGNLKRVVSGELERNQRKMALQLKDLEEAGAAESLRLAGELITANIYRIPRGSDRVWLPNYYDPAGTEIEVTLDPRLAPAENAQVYFRRYNRAKSTLTAASEHLARTRSEIAYLEQVDSSLEQAESLAELEEIREELASGGYIRKEPERKTGAPARERETSGPLRFTSSDGIEILVGKNNRQNDLLTLKMARDDDLWLHTKDIAGSHVIVRLPAGPGGGDIPDSTLLEAAGLAAYHSRGRQSSQVPVDYTLRRYVRKPPGAKPGMVIYDHHKTVYVTPEPALVERLRRSNSILRS